LRTEVETLSRSAGLAEQVRFRGWLPAEQVRTALAAADVLFQPSISEGLSVVTVEALREGLAFLASRIPGIEDVVVADENGLLCDVGAPESFTDALLTMIEDRPRVAAMRAASLARAPRFDLTRMIDDYEATLARAIARGQP
jgi:phosphatidylinositol alpha 1,6-mannosyltransferase